jgi:hypothetical protein
MSFQPDLIMNGQGPLRLQIDKDLSVDLLREQLERLLSDSPLTELEELELELEEDEQSQRTVDKKILAKERREARLKAQEEKYRQEQPSELFPELLPFLSDDNKHLWQPPKFPLPSRQDRPPSVQCMCYIYYCSCTNTSYQLKPTAMIEVGTRCAISNIQHAHTPYPQVKQTQTHTLFQTELCPKSNSLWTRKPGKDTNGKPS